MPTQIRGSDKDEGGEKAEPVVVAEPPATNAEPEPSSASSPPEDQLKEEEQDGIKEGGGDEGDEGRGDDAAKVEAEAEADAEAEPVDVLKDEEMKEAPKEGGPKEEDDEAKEEEAENEQPSAKKKRGRPRSTKKPRARRKRKEYSAFDDSDDETESDDEVALAVAMASKKKRGRSRQAAVKANKAMASPAKKKKRGSSATPKAKRGASKGRASSLAAAKKKEAAEKRERERKRKEQEEARKKREEEREARRKSVPEPLQLYRQATHERDEALRKAEEEAGGTIPEEEKAEIIRPFEEERKKHHDALKAMGLTTQGTKRKVKGQFKKPERRLGGQLKVAHNDLNTKKEELATAGAKVADAERALEEARLAVDAAKVEWEEAQHAVHAQEEVVLGAELAEDNAWTQRYRDLQSYREEHGHCNVSTKENYQLAKWCQKNRTLRKRFVEHGERPDLIPIEYYAKALDALGFDWTSPGNPGAQWQSQFDKMLAFQLEHGHCCVPKMYLPDKALGAWVHRQRYFYKLFHEGRMCQLTQERIDLLNSVGFQWSGDASAPPEETEIVRPTKPRDETDMKRSADGEWFHYYNCLKAFGEQHGHLRYRKQGPCAVSNFNLLRDWAAFQRRQYKLVQEGKPSVLSEERIRLLEDIGFEWKPARQGRPSSQGVGRKSDASEAGVAPPADESGEEALHTGEEPQEEMAPQEDSQPQEGGQQMAAVAAGVPADGANATGGTVMAGGEGHEEEALLQELEAAHRDMHESGLV